MHVGQHGTGAAGVHEKFRGGWRTGDRQICCRFLGLVSSRPHKPHDNTTCVTHCRPCPASALSIFYGRSSCRRALAAWRGPAAAPSCTRLGPRPGPRSERRRRPRCCPPSSASQRGSYSGPILQRQQPVTHHH